MIWRFGFEIPQQGNPSFRRRYDAGRTQPAMMSSSSSYSRNASSYEDAGETIEYENKYDDEDDSASTTTSMKNNLLALVRNATPDRVLKGLRGFKV
jgi:hypothetical protein